MTDELNAYEEGGGPGPARTAAADARTDAGPAPEAALDPPAGAGELLRAVMALTVAGLKSRTPLTAGPGDGGRRAAHAG
ncbi:hypothetical protein ABZS83_23460 [Streptomyces sp. NPDC005426]|uniref:hypothetical protein n=1 Tax=unclassified Streptomyces TaxID=2593676 RepID=UPI0033B83408